MAEGGLLLVCATPIGNLGDVSDRLREALQTADVVYAEDTRRTATLLQHVAAKPVVRSLFVGNESARVVELLAALGEGRTVALVTDAGMPGVSDPGTEAIRRAREAGFAVSVIPGPSAVTTAVALAGFGADRFVFEGFLPRKGKDRALRLASIAGEDRPVVLFISPHRLVADLKAIAAVIGPMREVAITRELTKLHEEVWVGAISGAIEEWSSRDPRGEFTVVVAPGPVEKLSIEDAIAEARLLVVGGSSPSEAARRVADSTGVSRRSVYQALIETQDRS
ncbi:MAG TPA: 16S rRNA (cytidine(1402)-2'-O)-methyltransferase [Acidimicrobiia bacterium]|nr:16S rRNA (cytidine(1402)-2'-O)-methyltransferase [Acidimicrobiia bacterium]